jgi:hypothetical protein
LNVLTIGIAFSANFSLKKELPIQKQDGFRSINQIYKYGVKLQLIPYSLLSLSFREI